VEKTSVKWSKIIYNRATIEQDIAKIMAERFSDTNVLVKSLDDLHDPYLLLGMEKAVERIKLAKDNKQKVIIFGDYDVDGVTSTSILMHFFKKIGIIASYRLPHRERDGYGLKKHFIDEASQLGVSLVITVDCGTRDVEVVKHASELWVDVIITDHHAVPKIIPKEAIALINPKNPECQYPFKWLAGAGVAFKLMQALAKHYLSEEDFYPYLTESIDIAAIGTVADCMSLTGENRVIVELGLKQLKQSRSRWVRALIEDKINTDLDADVFGFQIWPRLNAAGRMDSAYKAVNLLLNNEDSVNATLREIEQLNDERKHLTKIFTEDALQKVRKEDNLMFYVSKDIKHGIIGIVAGRITEQFHKPSIVLKDDGEKMVASCRSPEYFSMIDILEKYKDYFIAFGWHKQAAWFSISHEQYPKFKTAVLKELNQLSFKEHQKKIDIAKVVNINDLWFSFLKEVNKYKPFGIGNYKPQFMIENLDYDEIKFLGSGRDHMRFNTRQGFKIFAFFMWDFYEEIKIAARSKKPISIVFDLSEDNWQGRKNLMLKIDDVVIW